MAEILRDIGMIARALDSISNIEFKRSRFNKRTVSLFSTYLRKSWNHPRKTSRNDQSRSYNDCPSNQEIRIQWDDRTFGR